MHCEAFLTWYNAEPHDVGLSLPTPHDVRYGLAQAHWRPPSRPWPRPTPITLSASLPGVPGRPLFPRRWINPPNLRVTEEAFLHLLAGPLLHSRRQVPPALRLTVPKILDLHAKFARQARGV